MLLILRKIIKNETLFERVFHCCLLMICRSIRSNKIRMDSIGISVKILIGKDPDFEDRDTSMCQVDGTQMR